jgi:hypothetical protein
MEISDQLHDPSALLPLKNPGGWMVPRVGPGFGVEKLSLPPGFETQLVQSVAQSPFDFVLHADLRRYNMRGFHKSS